MYNVLTLNKIAACGTDLLDKGKYTVSDDEKNPDAILVRSASMHEMELSGNLLAIARAGAGVNNIPIDKCTEKGVVVFNTPGANANAVKELVIAGLLLSSRKISALSLSKFGKNRKQIINIIRHLILNSLCSKTKLDVFLYSHLWKDISSLWHITNSKTNTVISFHMDHVCSIKKYFFSRCLDYSHNTL